MMAFKFHSTCGSVTILRLCSFVQQVLPDLLCATCLLSR